jgi:hypothetical protein
MSLLCALVADRAAADLLERATLSFTLLGGVPVTLTSTSVAGTLSSGRFTLEPGSGFATSFCIGPAAAGCRPPPAPFAAPVTRIEVRAGRNGGIDGMLSESTIEPCGAGIACQGVFRAKIGKAPSFTLLPLAFRFGEDVSHQFMIGSGSLVGTLESTAWHLGAVTATGLTSRGMPRPDVMATGGASFVPGGLMLNLVTLSRLRVRGLGTFTTAMPVRLSLFYTHDHSLPASIWYCPEPGPVALLGGASLGLVGVGWRTRRRRNGEAN